MQRGTTYYTDANPGAIKKGPQIKDRYGQLMLWQQKSQSVMFVDTTPGGQEKTLFEKC